MFNFTEKAAIKIDDLILLNRLDIDDYIKRHSSLFSNMIIPFKTQHISYGVNQFGHYIKIAYDGNLVKKIVVSTQEEKDKNVKLVLSYDGSRFHGFQYQKNQRTVQGELNKVVGGFIEDVVMVQGASRTDAYVHAIEQVCHFKTHIDLDEDQLKEILNHQLPKDMVVKTVSFVHPLFHSRYDVFQKTYRYKIYDGAYDPFKHNYFHYENNLDIQLMKEAISGFIGTYDFTSFSKSIVDDPYRTITDAYIETYGNETHLVFVGYGFLRHMVRIMVDYLLKVGQKKLVPSIEQVRLSRSRFYTNSMAPAQGLYLEKIEY